MRVALEHPLTIWLWNGLQTPSGPISHCYLWVISTGRFRFLLVFKGMVLLKFVSGAMFGIALGHLPPQQLIIGLLRMLRAELGPLLVQLIFGFAQLRLLFPRRLHYLRLRLLPTSCARSRCLSCHLWPVHTSKATVLTTHLLVTFLSTDMLALVLYRRVALQVTTKIWCLGLVLSHVPLQISHWCRPQRHQL